MILYLIKTIACSAVFLVAYKLLLENAKMNRFKRFYLLFCSLLSFVLPALSFPGQSSRAIQYLPAMLFRNPSITSPAITGIPVIADSHFATFMLTIYCLISIVLAFRFFRNIFSLYHPLGADNMTFYEGIKVIVTDKAPVPYSFINRIFVPGNEFRDGTIDDRIMRHEAAHVRQKHSLDILYIELLRVVSWYNPLLYGYKKSIQLNHEFLADQSVIEEYPDRSDYQNLVLQYTKQGNGFQFTSSFNFLTTKKRLQMITQSTSLRTVSLKITVVIPIIAGCIYLFPGRSYAQDELPIVLVHSTKSDGQKKSAMYVIGTRPALSAKKVPATQQFESWKNARVFGVWIDGKKITNDQLNNYKNTDFSQADVSEVRGTEKEYVTYQYMVDLMTNGYYKAQYDKDVLHSGRSVISVRTLQKEKN